jgi:hypothetical protein
LLLKEYVDVPKALAFGVLIYSYTVFVVTFSGVNPATYFMMVLFTTFTFSNTFAFEVRVGFSF